MSEWIGDRAAEAVIALSRRMKDLEYELEKANLILDSYDVDRIDSVSELVRSYSVSERIQILYEKNRELNIDAHLNAIKKEKE